MAKLKRINGEIIGEGETIAGIVQANKANLDGAYLRGADLDGAYLRGAIGNCMEIITTQTDRWTITRTADVMQIGCQRHSIERWWAFSDRQIEAMDENALEWWRKWKPILQEMIEIAPARPTRHENDEDR
ncbi:MAG: pentapeptide repeat-containing protein [Woeseia sp.]|nr:pentapeptide repeat-containing protein [Woeseia sp.]